MTRSMGLGITGIVSLAALLAGCGSSSDTTGQGSGDRHLVVLFTSDEHSQLFASGPELDDYPLATAAGSGPLVGGIARRATLIKQARADAAKAHADAILLSGGDNHMGCLSEVAFESKGLDLGLMKALGYDATTLGNHEFDFGPGALATALGAAGTNMPPIVASNIHFSNTAGDAALAALYSSDVSDAAAMHPYRVLTTPSGLKVGLLGYVGVNASYVAPNKAPVAFSEQGVDPAKASDPASVLPHLYADLQPVVDELRNDEKVDLVIALAHGGINNSETEAGLAAGDDWNVCKNVSGIDFVISGHAHNADPKPIEVQNTQTGDFCLVLNASALGRHLGRVELTVPKSASKKVSWDGASQALTLVDEQVVPDSEAAQATLAAVETIEQEPYLPALLSRVSGSSVQNDPQKPGDLYFWPVSKTSFDVSDTHTVLYLSADAMLSAADEWGKAASVKTDMGLESAGVIRAILSKGKTGVISAADAFDVVPLGASPVDGSVGYPLVRANLMLIELRGVFELARAVGPTDSDYDLAMSGVRVEYDATRPVAKSLADILDPSKGQVMRILLDTDHKDGYEQYDKVIYDRAQGIAVYDLVSVVTSSYIAQFAKSAGVTLKDDAGNPLTIDQAILARPDKSEVKQVESFLGYLHAQPTLPDRYDTSSANATKRWVCVKGC